MNYSVPFYSNLPDNTHCFQACFKMVLKHFLPSQDFAWEELDRITGKEKDLWTWPLAGLLWLCEKGFDVVNIDVFDIQSFVTAGENYVLDFYGQEVGRDQIKYSHIALEQERAAKFLKTVNTQVRVPNHLDIISLLNAGYIIITNVNAEALNKQAGYTGHFIVITGYKNNTLYFHNPGLPRAPNSQISFVDFELAWSYPNEEARNLIGIKKSL